MYIQRVPHPLTHFNNRELNHLAFRALPTNNTISSTISQPKRHPAGYLILAVVLAVLLLSLTAICIARRHVRSLLPCTIKRNTNDEKVEPAPRMQREGRTRFTDGFDIVPSLAVRTGSGSGSGSSHTPSSPCSEGPPTPFAGEQHEHDNIGATTALDYAKEESLFVPIPIIVHTPTQTHQTTFLTGPDVLSPDFTAPAAHHEHFFDGHPSLMTHGSLIRPHGLPLSPVPEESSAIVSFPSAYFHIDEETLYGTSPGLFSAH